MLKIPLRTSTKDIQINTISLTELKKDHAIIFDISSVKKSLEDDRKMMNEAYQELPRKNVIEVKNTYFFKCPLNTVILSHTNEIDFTRYLIDKRYVNKISAWIKVSDKGFYDIPYSYRKGIHQKEAKFNPDFFIKIGKAIVVVEIKSDDDVNIINKAKL